VGIVVGLLLALLVAGAPTPADATGLKITGNSAAYRRQNVIGRDTRAGSRDPRDGYTDPRADFTDPRAGYTEPRVGVDQRDPKGDRFHRRPDGSHQTPVIVVPQPVYVIAQQRCVVQGYWAYTWVPQSYVSNEWVPGYYNTDALWVEGHYEPRANTWGYYQPYWVPERSTAC